MLMMHFVGDLSTFVVIILAFGGFFVAVAVLYTLRLQLRLRRMRGMTRPEFANFFADNQDGARVAECVFDEYRSELFGSGFTLSPDTDLGRAFDQESEDIRNTAVEIAAKLDLPPLPDNDLKTIASERNFTARQLVEILSSHSRRHKKAV